MKSVNLKYNAGLISQSGKRADTQPVTCCISIVLGGYASHDHARSDGLTP